MFRFRKKKEIEVPTGTICRNCETQTVGRYCHACGQDVLSGQGQPIFQFIANLLDNAFAFDHKVWLTIRYLLFKPGFLSNEYRQGRIIRYVQPVKLFWMSTLIFFALLIWTIDANYKKNIQHQKQSENVQTTDTLSAATAEIPRTSEVKNLATVTMNGKNKMDISYYQIKDSLSTYIPYTAFLFIPIFALLLKLFFLRKKYFYMHHLIFAVHFHSFLWVMCSLLLIINFVFPNYEFPNWLNFIILLFPEIYLMLAFYCFYQPRRKWSVIWKSVAVTLLYFLLIFLFIVGALLLAYMIWGV
jgi:hypothetical protein